MFQSVGDFETNIALQYAKAFISQEVLLSNQKTVKECKTFADKVDFLTTFLSADLNDVKSDLRQRSLDNFSRFQSIGALNFQHKIKSNVTLAKPSTLVFHDSSEDYGLSKICDGKVDVQNFGGNHMTILQQEKQVKSIQSWLDECEKK